MKPAILSLWLLAAGVCCAAPFIDEPVAELRLKSGKTYRDAITKSFTPTSIFVKHADGGVSIKYDDLPDDLATAAASKRPAPPTAEQLAEQERRRQASLAAERKKLARPVQKSGPSMPLNLSDLGLSVTSIKGNLALVEIHNFSRGPYGLGPHSLVATTSDGRKLPGQSWVGTDSTGRVTVIMRDSQTISTSAASTLTAMFPLPEGSSIISVDWTHPKH